jgi:cell division protein ZapE
MTKATYSEQGRESRWAAAASPTGGAPRASYWFDFAELFEKPRSQVDYLEIASATTRSCVSGVKRMQPAQTDVVRRFTWLVDVFYDQRVKLVLSADAPARGACRGVRAGERPGAHG